MPLSRGLASKNFRIQNNAVALLDIEQRAAVDQLKNLAKTATETSVRESALARLAEVEGDSTMGALYREVLSKDRSYGVKAAALQGLYQVDPVAGAAEAKKLESSDKEAVIVGLAKIYAGAGDAAYLPYFESKIRTIDNQSAGEFAGAYLGLALQGGAGAVERAVEQLSAVALDQKSSLWQRYSFTAALAELRGAANNPNLKAMLGGADITPMLTAKIDAIKAAETNPQLQGAFSAM